MTDEPKTDLVKQRLTLLRDLVTELNHLQWYNPGKLQQIQTTKLRALVNHHAVNSPYFQNQLKASGAKPSDINAADMSKLPLLTRRDIQSAGEDFFARSVPESHGKLGEVKTSGSTGQFVKIKATDVVSQFFHAFNVQENIWHNRDLKMRMCVIKAGGTYAENSRKPNWGLPYVAMGETGEVQLIDITTDVEEQNKIIQEFQPEYLLTYPNNIRALLEIWQRDGNAPAIKHFKSVGETVSEELRDLVKTVLGIKVEDVYSSQEMGTIAQTCWYGTYHTMDQNLIVEILDDDNQPVAQGETGRVVITDLHNYASPMIRYEIGDYAVRGSECQCGRGLQTLVKVRGRERNLICHADGSRHWPQVGMYQFDTLDFLVRRYQVVQHSLTDIEYRIVVDEPVSESQQQDLINLAAAAMGSEFTYRVTQQTSDFAVNPNGKFEEFVCKI